MSRWDRCIRSTTVRAEMQVLAELVQLHASIRIPALSSVTVFCSSVAIARAANVHWKDVSAIPRSKSARGCGHAAPNLTQAAEEARLDQPSKARRLSISLYREAEPASGRALVVARSLDSAVRVHGDSVSFQHDGVELSLDWGERLHR